MKRVPVTTNKTCEAYFIISHTITPSCLKKVYLPLEIRRFTNIPEQLEDATSLIRSDPNQFEISIS